MKCKNILLGVIIAISLSTFASGVAISAAPDKYTVKVTSKQFGNSQETRQIRSGQMDDYTWKTVPPGGPVPGTDQCPNYASLPLDANGAMIRQTQVRLPTVTHPTQVHLPATARLTQERLPTVTHPTRVRLLTVTPPIRAHLPAAAWPTPDHLPTAARVPVARVMVVARVAAACVMVARVAVACVMVARVMVTIPLTIRRRATRPWVTARTAVTRPPAIRPAAAGRQIAAETLQPTIGYRITGIGALATPQLWTPGSPKAPSEKRWVRAGNRTCRP